MTEQEELEQIYAEAWEDNIVLYEYTEMASAGDLRDWEFLFDKSPIEDEEEFQKAMLGSLGIVVDISFPGSGTTRVEKLRDAIAKFREARAAGRYPRLSEVRRRAGLPITGEKPLGTF